MAYEQKNLTGALFRNDRRENDKQPTHTGTAKIEGVDYYMDAWVKTAQNGRKFFSVSFKRKDQTRAATPEGAAPVATPQPMPLSDEEIPF